VTEKRLHSLKITLHYIKLKNAEALQSLYRHLYVHAATANSSQYATLNC